MAYYPIMMELGGQQCVVVGGGTVAERRTAGLLEAGARVRVVSPALTDTLSRWAAVGQIEYWGKRYETQDAADAVLIIAATDCPETNRQVGEDARVRRQLVCRADRPEAGTFIVPGSVRRGRLLLSVTTGGASPGLTAAIRDELAGHYGEDYEKLTDLLAEYRMKVREYVKDAGERQKLLRCAAPADWRTMLEQKGLREYSAKLQTLINGLEKH
ncbi:precorrin-2 dehydrogenase/sirohydrochlorin ferrochelatase family protein [Paenibacillus sp. y28]|uniref:precorrin-2 dehydrogenase/sirohydrochlorin ferrochelatase family protein n=1 Tax=Paenibacillus sp. y28 TaxID=3129110 RepID=UPI0030187EEA